MCYDCPLRRTCSEVCNYVETRLPSMEAGRVDHEDLARLYRGRLMVNALLDNVDVLTERQQQVVHLYYQKSLQQREIATLLNITQQAVGDALARAKLAVGRKLKQYCSFL